MRLFTAFAPARFRGRFWPLALMALLLGGCEADYFPLGGGKSWQYKLSFDFSSRAGAVTAKSVRLNLPKKVTFDDGGGKQKAVGQLHENGFIYLYKRLKEPEPGVYRLAVKQDKLYYQPRPLMVLPDDPKVGDSWLRPDRTYLMVHRHLLDIGARTYVRVDMRYRVEAVGVKVATSAGEFEDCLYVVGYGRTDFVGERGVGDILVEVREENWFAPSVGLVKMERAEATDTELYGTQRFSMELEEYKG